MWSERSEKCAEAVLSRMAVEYWKLLRAFQRVAVSENGDLPRRAASQHKYSAQQLAGLLDEAGLRAVTFDQQPFSAGLPVQAINSDDFESDDGLLIAATIEPTIVREGTVVRIGKVSLARAGHNGEGK